jgi:hypothetical protein
VESEAITVQELHTRWCSNPNPISAAGTRAETYCILLTTTNLEDMKRAHGDLLGDVEYDAYYDTFFAFGCQGDWGTSVFDSSSNLKNNCEGDTWRVLNADSDWARVAEIQATEGEGSGGRKLQAESDPDATNADTGVLNSLDRYNVTTSWTLEHCCYSNFCNAAGRVGGGALTLAGLGFIAGSAMIALY